jgi:choline dehydrogenase-like flavoprotein
MSDVFVRAAQQAGIAFTADPNGAEQDGVFYNQVTQRNARRESASTAFLDPIKGRQNLVVQTNSTVSRIVVRNGRAVGVEYLHKGKRQFAESASEVILSAGAINSPRLMLLSGIGDAGELASVGVESVHHLPGVGKNLQDQLEAFIATEVTNRTPTTARTVGTGRPFTCFSTASTARDRPPQPSAKQAPSSAATKAFALLTYSFICSLLTRWAEDTNQAAAWAWHHHLGLQHPSEEPWRAPTRLIRSERPPRG